MKTALTLACLAVVASVVHGLKEGDCEVCINVLNRFRDQESSRAVKDNADKLSTGFKEFCKDLKGKDNRFVSFGVK